VSSIQSQQNQIFAFVRVYKYLCHAVSSACAVIQHVCVRMCGCVLCVCHNSLCVRTYVYIFVCVCVQFKLCVCVCVRCVCVLVYVCVCMCICVGGGVNVCVYMVVCVCERESV